jgi:hypothetical protein
MLHETPASSMIVKNRETVTLEQSAQEALDLERERYLSRPCLKGPDGLEKERPTSDAVTVLRNEERRRKVKHYRSTRDI